jgi:hypothetical protein
MGVEQRIDRNPRAVEEDVGFARYGTIVDPMTQADLLAQWAS